MRTEKNNIFFCDKLIPDTIYMKSIRLTVIVNGVSIVYVLAYS